MWQKLLILWQPLSAFFRRPFFRSQRFILGLWSFAAFLASLHLVLLGPRSYNNYLIFKHAFWHTLAERNLYAQYPDVYFDTNHYGPVFSLVIAPFALLPDWLGIPLWGLAMALVLFYAIRQLPVDWMSKVAIYYICFLEMITAATNLQTNAMIAGLIILTFTSVQRGKDFWAGLFIALGAFIKLYGIVGLAFFFFAKHKPKFILGCLCWGVVCFVAPMLISSPEFVLQSYADWYASLTEKNLSNAASLGQDISVMGMARRISGQRELSNMLFLAPGALLFALQYIKVNYFGDLRYRLGILASTLMFVVLFSSGSESSGYIIAMSGVAIWFIFQAQPRSGVVWFLLVFALVVTSFSASDLFPAYIRRTLIVPYALKALPCFMVWLALLWQLLTFNTNRFREFIVSK